MDYNLIIHLEEDVDLTSIYLKSEDVCYKIFGITRFLIHLCSDNVFPEISMESSNIMFSKCKMKSMETGLKIVINNFVSFLDLSKFYGACVNTGCKIYLDNKQLPFVTNVDLDLGVETGRKLCLKVLTEEFPEELFQKMPDWVNLIALKQ